MVYELAKRHRQQGSINLSSEEPSTLHPVRLQTFPRGHTATLPPPYGAAVLMITLLSRGRLVLL